MIIGFIVATLLGAATWYFLCGISEEVSKSEGKDKGIGCVTALVLGLIGAIIWIIFEH